jgi:hypothetical protein
MLRSTPDFLVYDERTNNIYPVELKTTKQPSSRWRYPKRQLDALHSFHVSAWLLVYFQREHRFFIEKVSNIDWAELPIVSNADFPYSYQIDVAYTFHELPDVFKRIEAPELAAFMEQMTEVFNGFT